jgi:hypothetical protein
MTTEDFIIELFCRVDDTLGDIPKHPQAHLYPSELITIGLVFALKGGGSRQFYRWFIRDYHHLFPKLPERTRLFRLLKKHWDKTDYFLADPTILGITDTYGIELIHPIREGRSPQQIGKKGKSNHRWIVGAKFAFILNKFGLFVDWACDTANVHDSTFRPLLGWYADSMVILSDGGFHGKVGDPSNMKVCKRGTWNVRMLVETVLSMLTTVCHIKQMHHRVWSYFQARLGYLVALFNLLVQWHGLEPDEHGRIHLSIAEFSL